MLQIFLERLSHLGEVPLCNGMPQRALHILGFCFPLCYRCMAVVFAFLFGIWWYHRHHRIFHSLKIMILCMLPMVIDGGIQTFWGIMSTNWRRCWSGALFGLALAMLVTWLYERIDEKVTR